MRSNFETQERNKVTIKGTVTTNIILLPLCIGLQNTEINILLRSARRDDHDGIQILVVRSSDQKSIIGTKMLLFDQNYDKQGNRSPKF